MRDFLPMKNDVQEEVVSLELEQQIPKESVIQMHEKPNGQKAHVPEHPENPDGFKVSNILKDYS